MKKIKGCKLSFVIAVMILVLLLGFLLTCLVGCTKVPNVTNVTNVTYDTTIVKYDTTFIRDTVILKDTSGLSIIHYALQNTNIKIVVDSQKAGQVFEHFDAYCPGVVIGNYVCLLSISSTTSWYSKCTVVNTDTLRVYFGHNGIHSDSGVVNFIY